MGWDGMGWDGMGCGGVGWDEMQWDAMGCNGMQGGSFPLSLCSASSGLQNIG